MLPAAIGLRVIGLGAETGAGAAVDVTVAGVVAAGVADAGATDAAVMVEATAAVVVGTKLFLPRIYTDLD
jgi:hypothetical protein